MAKQKKSALGFLLKLLASAALLVFFFLTKKISFAAIGRELAGVAWSWLVVAFALNAVGLFASAYRWHILARALGDDIPVGFLIRSYLVGMFFNNFLPTRFGGDVVRIWDGSKYSRSLVRSSAVVLVDRATGIIVLFLFALAASLFRLDMAREVPVVWAALLIGAAGLLAVALFFLPVTGRLIEGLPARGILHTVRGKVLDLRATILAYRKAPGDFARATVWAVVLQLNVVIYYFLIGKALHLAIPLLDYFIVIPIVLLVQVIPISVNGWGLREASYIEIFAFYGIGAAAAVSFSLIEVAFGLAVGLVGGAIYIARK
jgi:glycosyltransferase 2 family protein